MYERRQIFEIFLDNIHFVIRTFTLYQNTCLMYDLELVETLRPLRVLERK